MDETYTPDRYKSRQYPFWHLVVSSYVLVSLTNRKHTPFRGSQDNPMNIPTTFGSSWPEGFRKNMKNRQHFWRTHTLRPLVAFCTADQQQKNKNKNINKTIQTNNKTINYLEDHLINNSTKLASIWYSGFRKQKRLKTSDTHFVIFGQLSVVDCRSTFGSVEVKMDIFFYEFTKFII